jgi:hypothetical protein
MAEGVAGEIVSVSVSVYDHVDVHDHVHAVRERAGGRHLCQDFGR